MRYYKVIKDITLCSKKKASRVFMGVYKPVELIENELITEKELKRLQIDQYKDNRKIFDVIVTSSHNTYFFFGARFLVED